MPEQRDKGPYESLSNYLSERYLPGLVAPVANGLAQKADVLAYTMAQGMDLFVPAAPYARRLAGIEDDEARAAAFRSIKAGLIHDIPAFAAQRGAAWLDATGGALSDLASVRAAVSRSGRGPLAAPVGKQERPFEDVAAPLRASFVEHAQAAEEMVGPDERIAHRVMRGVAQSPAWLAEGLAATATMGAAGLPVALGVAASRDPVTGEATGPVETAKGAIHGALMHGIGAVAAPLPTLTQRATVGGAGFGGLAALSGAEDKDVVASAILGAGMQAAMPGRAAKARERVAREEQESGVSRVEPLPEEVYLEPASPPGAARGPAQYAEEVGLWQQNMRERRIEPESQLGIWSRDTKLPENLPPELEMDFMMREMQKVGGARRYFEERSGKRTHAETLAAAEDVVYGIGRGMSPKEIAIMRQENRAFDEVELAAAEKIVLDRMEDVAVTRAKVPEGTREDAADYLRAVTRMATTSYETEAAKSTAGRALNILKATKQERLKARAIDLVTQQHKERIAKLSQKEGKDLVDAYGGLEEVRILADTVGRLDNPAEVASVLGMAHEGATRGLVWKAMDYWIAGLLSGFSAHKTNVTSNGLFAGWFHGVEQPLEAGIGLAKAPFQKALGRDTSDRVYMREVLPGLYGLKQGIPKAFEAAQKAYGTGEEWTISGGIGRSKYGTFRSGQKPLAPFRALTSEDAFSAYSNSSARAYQLGAREALDLKIPANEFDAHVQQFVKDVFKPPRSATVERLHQLRKHQADIMKRADMLKFTEEVGPTAEALIRFSNSHPLAKPVLPFVRTLVNVSKQTAYRTPLALVGAIPGVGRVLTPKLHADFYAGGQRQNAAIARVAAGTGLAMYFWDQFRSGEMTGAPPADPLDRELDRSRGIMPFSKAGKGVEGDDLMRSYARLEPLAGPVAVLGTLNAWHSEGLLSSEDAEEVIPLVGAAIAENLVNKSYLQGPKGAMMALSEPQRHGQRFLESMFGSMVPALANQIAVALDPTRRDRRGFVSAVKSRIPGMRETLPEMPDLAGRPQIVGDPGKQFFARLVSEYETPIRPTVVLDAMALSGSRIQPIGEKIHIKKDDFWSQTDPGMMVDAAGLERNAYVKMTPHQRAWLESERNKRAHAELEPIVTRLMQARGKDEPLSLRDLRDAGASRELLDGYRSRRMMRASINTVIRDEISMRYRFHYLMQSRRLVQKWRDNGRLRKELDAQISQEESRAMSRAGGRPGSMAWGADRAQGGGR